MSRHANRESRFDEPPEPDRRMPGDAHADKSKLSPEPTSVGEIPEIVTDLSAEIAALHASDPTSDWSALLTGQAPADTPATSPDVAASSGRSSDCFAPPEVPCPCHCLHCGRTFSSADIWFQKVINDPQGFPGFWMCPTPNCSGSGFTFDIFPTDPDHPANEGWHDDDEECDDEFDDELSDAEDWAEWDELDDDEVAATSDVGDFGFADDGLPTDAEYDPAEPQYREMDDFFGDADDDLEGEEWKYGLEPGERPAEPAWREEARRQWEQDQQRYDEPDQRPRVLDWSNRTDRRDDAPNLPYDGSYSDDDIPF